MYFVFAARQVLIESLPPGGVVAEIGVAEGLFSDFVMSAAQPRTYHLIDPWEHQDRADYEKDINNVSAVEHDTRYENIVSRYSDRIDAGQVVLHRNYSDQVVEEFEDGYFDWVYIDGLHTYDGVKSDLANYYDKVKPGGFILGHDYANHALAQNMGFGVIEAVNEFVAENGCEMLFLTAEEYPTYLLAKEMNREAFELLTRVMLTGCNVVEIGDSPPKFNQTIMKFGNELKLMNKFGG